VADLRSRTDHEVIAALLNIADSRFQAELLAQARAAGKIAADYRIPDAFRNNTPARLTAALAGHRSAGFFSEYPFGTDLTGEEITLARALKHLESGTTFLSGRIRTVGAALARGTPPARYDSLLARMRLNAPRTLRERVLRRVVVLALEETGA
jgi:hypothetical protein